MKKLLLLILCVAVSLCGCGNKIPEADEGLSVVATIFPHYDFARRVAGDLANIKLLIKPGAESHTFEPSAQDIISISEADVFLYTHSDMEPWAERIISTAGENTEVVRLADSVELAEMHEGHNHKHDPHIWTSPLNVIKMVEKISEVFSEKDPDNSEAYKKNASEFIEELKALDSEFRKIVSEAKRKKIVFGGRFALLYFAEEYGLTVSAAFDSCISESEPGAGTVARLTDEIRNEKIPVIYYEELTEPKTAMAIGESTGAKPLLLHSCHNVSKEEFEKGIGYLDLMKQNVINLREGLN